VPPGDDRDAYPFVEDLMCAGKPKIMPSNGRNARGHSVGGLLETLSRNPWPRERAVCAGKKLHEHFVPHRQRFCKVLFNMVEQVVRRVG
jgi:hypothetical protein